MSVYWCLGAFVSCFETLSLNLFINIQYNTASVLGILELYAISMQCVRAVIGNMVCINNVVAFSEAIGTSGKEEKLIKSNAISMAIYALLTS